MDEDVTSDESSSGAAKRCKLETVQAPTALDINNSKGGKSSTSKGIESIDMSEDIEDSIDKLILQPKYCQVKTDSSNTDGDCELDRNCKSDFLKKKNSAAVATEINLKDIGSGSSATKDDSKEKIPSLNNNQVESSVNKSINEGLASTSADNEIYSVVEFEPDLNFFDIPTLNNSSTSKGIDYIGSSQDSEDSIDRLILQSKYCQMKSKNFKTDENCKLDTNCKSDSLKKEDDAAVATEMNLEDIGSFNSVIKDDSKEETPLLKNNQNESSVNKSINEGLASTSVDNQIDSAENEHNFKGFAESSLDQTEALENKKTYLKDFAATLENEENESLENQPDLNYFASTSADNEQTETQTCDNDVVTRPRNRRNYRMRAISSSSSSEMDLAHEHRRVENNQFNDSASNSDEDNENSDDGTGSSYHLSITSPSPDSSLNGILHSDDSDDESQTDVNSIQEILTRKKPEYTTNLLYEIMYRENGLSGLGRSHFRRRDPMVFQNGICKSRLTIEKMQIMHKLKKHKGCVNSLNFNRAGNLLCTGSDDLKIILWDWANKKMKFSFQSGHNSNVFQSKFVELSGGINIVSSSRDGQVRHQSIPPSGYNSLVSTVLYKHNGPVHKIAPSPTNQYEILTAGEDGHVVRCDLREKPIERLITIKKKSRRVGLYSIAHHPLDQEFCVAGRDQYVRVYDKRNTKNVIFAMCPEQNIGENKSFGHITCAVYNQTGTEILASYNDDDIYLFNSKCYLPGHYTHRYKGRSNNKTIKGVNFFGPNSEYIVSGSDCGNLFIWDKETESILNWQKGDNTGIVNCLEPHPHFPVLATSGLDTDVKIWAPLAKEYPPSMEGLEKSIKMNAKRSAMANEIFDETTFLFFIRECRRNRFTTRSAGRDDSGIPNVQDLVSSDSDESRVTDPDDEHARLRPCATQ